MNGVIAMQGRTLDIRSLTGDDGGNGDIQIAGQIDLNDVTRPVVNISANANNMQFINDDVMQLQLDANTRVVTENGIYTITGQIGADYINYTLPDRFDKRIPELNIVDEIEDGQTSLLEAVRLNMDFDSRRNINISGWGLDVRLGGSLNVVGTAAEPDVIGQLQVVRGHYEEFGRRFELGESSFRFQGPIPPSPYLNVNAVTEVEDIQAIIQMRGPATDPQIEFSSSPAMAEDRVLALILFGKDITQISPFQALQLASTARRFSGRGAGLDPLGEIQNATGLDDLRIEGGTGEGVTVGAGKYLSDDVYLEVQQGSEEGAGAARVEVELTPSVTIESQVGSRGDTGGGIFWEWDY